MPKIRIGIDVGGTFTHAVALDNETYQIVGSALVPTTHAAAAGVAKGIVECLFKLIKENSLNPAQVSFIAHSTTQATNALLEGDLAKVGVIGMGKGLEGIRVKGQAKVTKPYRYYDTAKGIKEGEIRNLIQELKKEGAQVLVAAEAFAVDDPENENQVMILSDIPVCGSHEISGVYGLKMRTRTAAVNASILPKMLEAATLTAQSVKEAGILSPLMVVRNDGGVINMAEVKKRPILTILSGPAAGVAAALLHTKISDGIFIEVGGTSTDITAIKDGKALIRTAEVGGHKLFLKTLDVRTVGVAGGSLPKVKGNKVIEVGPRSAHILGLPYVCFSNPAEILEPELVEFEGYSVIQSKDGKKFAFTATCAEKLKRFGPFTEKMAAEILNLASIKIIKVVAELIKEYKFDKDQIELIGGGGGAEVLVPAVGKKLGMKSKIAENAPLISAIGAALALVSETIEKSIINPTEEEILRLRQEAEARVVQMGARPETVEVTIEVDKHKNLVKALAQGATEFRTKDLLAKQLTRAEKSKIAAESLGVTSVSLLASTGKLAVFGAEISKGFFKRNFHPIRVMDQEGIIRLKRDNMKAIEVAAENATEVLKKNLEQSINYGDAGAILPEVFMLCRSKILNFSSLTTVKQIISLLSLEIKDLLPREKVIILLADG